MPRPLTLLAALAPALLLAAGCTAHRRAGTGDVAFRLVWEGASDLDLFVRDPAGACIYFGERESATGGVLDVDCNSGTDRVCERPVENVFWPAGSAPPGEYRVWVHAHSLLPAEAPLPFQLQLLLGTDVAWVHRGTLAGHQELQGPFVYAFPGGRVLRSAEGSPEMAARLLPPGCGDAGGGPPRPRPLSSGPGPGRGAS